MLGLRERKKARTKATIQREALRLFSRDGYAATSVEQIAAAAEVSPSTFFRYFPTKEDVVLADFIDARAVQRVVDAPPELSPVAALKFAIESVFSDMSEEDLELERLRNELIQTVPELRRGMVSEMMRPMHLLADAFARRLGVAPDDPDIQMYAGAVTGALVIGADAEHLRGRRPQELYADILARFDRLELMVRLPPAPGSRKAR